jgi:predicted nucleotidyltransferase
MRLQSSEINIIKNSILKYISDAKIMLFGSRVDDNKRGGDIDIFIETKQDINMLQQIKILTDIEFSGLSRKVDLLIKTPNSKNQTIFITATKEGIVL